MEAVHEIVAEAEDIENNFQAANRIESLQQQGINAADITKLKQSGFHSVESMLMATKKEVLTVRGITEARYANLMKAASDVTQMGTGNFKSAGLYRLDFKNRFRITTGSTELDNILGGGVESMALTEIHGEYRTGKSQICMTLAVTAQMGKHPGKVIYIDTEGTFRPERVAEICNRYSLDSDIVLDNILFARVYNVDQQEELPVHIEAKIAEDNTSYSLIIVDSMMNLWRSDFSGRGELSERQQRLGRHLNILKKIVERHNLALVFTNLVMSDPGAGMTYVPDPKKAVGGHVLAHAATVRVMLKKGRDNERIAKLVDSPDMPEAEARFAITQNGISECE